MKKNYTTVCKLPPALRWLILLIFGTFYLIYFYRLIKKCVGKLDDISNRPEISVIDDIIWGFSNQICLKDIPD